MHHMYLWEMILWYNFSLSTEDLRKWHRGAKVKVHFFQEGGVTAVWNIQGSKSDQILKSTKKFFEYSGKCQQIFCDDC